MDIKKILSTIDTIEADNKSTAIIMESSSIVEKPKSSIIEKYMNEIMEEQLMEHNSKLEEAKKIAEHVSSNWFAKHHLGHGERMDRDMKKSHGLRGSVKKSARYGASKRVHYGKHHLHGIYETTDGMDYVSLDIPLLIRLLEYAREDAQTDMDLHNVAEKLIQLNQENVVLSMDHYESIVGPDENS